MHRTLILVLGLLFLSSCTTFTLAPALPASTTEVNAINVEYGSELDAKKTGVLDRYKMKDVFIAALRGSFATGGDTTLQVTITQFRTGGYGPTRMHAVANLMDASGAVVKSMEADSTSVMRGVAAVAQEVVNQIGAGL